MSRILITGGTGNVGGQVLSQLISMGAQVRTVVVRHPETARFSLVVEAVHGDLTIPETLDECIPP
jgi:uncharacterized protein YbjT (DUF2867 family)